MKLSTVILCAALALAATLSSAEDPVPGSVGGITDAGTAPSNLGGDGDASGGQSETTTNEGGEGGEGGDASAGGLDIVPDVLPQGDAEELVPDAVESGQQPGDVTTTTNSATDGGDSTAQPTPVNGGDTVLDTTAQQEPLDVGVGDDTSSDTGLDTGDSDSQEKPSSQDQQPLDDSAPVLGDPAVLEAPPSTAAPLMYMVCRGLDLGVAGDVLQKVKCTDWADGHELLNTFSNADTPNPEFTTQYAGKFASAQHNAAHDPTSTSQFIACSAPAAVAKAEAENSNEVTMVKETLTCATFANTPEMALELAGVRTPDGSFRFLRGKQDGDELGSATIPTEMLILN